MHIMHFNLWHRCQKPTSKQRSTSCFIIIASQQNLVMLNSHMNSANKAIYYAEVINMYSFHELFNSTPVHNTPQWYIQCILILVLKMCIFCRLNSTRQLQWYTTFTVVHNIHSGAQHINDTETFRLPEPQVASIMISICLASTLKSQC